jgi:hypothetical protein
MVTVLGAAMRTRSLELFKLGFDSVYINLVLNSQSHWTQDVQASLLLFLFAAFVASVCARTFSVVNECSYNVWFVLEYLNCVDETHFFDILIRTATVSFALM